MTDPDALAELHATTTAPWLAWAVHTRDAALVAELLEPLDRQGLYALAVALASQVPRPRTRPDDGVVDEVAVERAADLFERVGPLTRAERAAAVRLMSARGIPNKHIMSRLGVSGSTLVRIRGSQEREGAA